MPLEINRTWGANNPLINPDVKISDLSSDLNSWAPVNSGGGGSGVAPVVSGAAGEVGDFEITAGTGRSGTTRSAAVEAGKFYYLVAELVSLTGAAVDSSNFGLINLTNATNVTPGQVISAATPGFYGIRYEAIADGVVGMRVGLGIITGGQTGPATAQWRVVSNIEVDSLTAAPPLSIYLEAESNSGQRGAIGRLNVNTSVFNETTGEITYSEGAALPNLQAHSNVLYVSDSYGNDGTEWPFQLVTVNTNMALRGSSNSGNNTTALLARYDDTISLDGLPYNGPAHTAIICQPSVNDFNSASYITGSVALANVGAMIDKANAAGLLAIVPNMPKVANITAGVRTTEFEVFQNGVEALADSKSALFVDVASPLTAGGGTLGYVDAAYANVDGDHLIEAGYVIYAATLNSAIVNYSAGAPTLTTPYPDLSHNVGDTINQNLATNWANPNLLHFTIYQSPDSAEDFTGLPGVAVVAGLAAVKASYQTQVKATDVYSGLSTLSPAFTWDVEKLAVNSIVAQQIAASDGPIVGTVPIDAFDAPVTALDSGTDLIPRKLYAAVTGDVVLVGLDGVTFTYTVVVAGIQDVAFVQINAVGTTGTIADYYGLI